MGLNKEEQILMIVVYGIMIPVPLLFLYVVHLGGGFERLSFDYGFFRFYFPVMMVYSTLIWIGIIYVRRKFQS